MKNQYLIVCDQQGNYIDARCIGHSDEIDLNSLALIIQAAVWNGWAIKLTTEVPAIDIANSPVLAWLNRTQAVTPKLLTEWRELNQIIAILDAKIAEQDNQLLEKDNQADALKENINQQNEDIKNLLTQIAMLNTTIAELQKGNA